jgi:NCS1 family nucleobase:cation symporter-1
MAKKNSLASKDLLPVIHTNRKVGTLGFSFMWIGMAVIIATFAIGGEGVKALTLGWVVLACFLANFVLGFFISFTGDIGIEHGLSFPVYMRAPFGTIGTHIPSVSRGIVAAAWFGIQTYFGALAINYIFKYFSGFDNWFVWYLIFAIVQVLNTAYGIKAVEKFADIAAPCIIIISIWMYIRLEGIASDAGINVWTTIVGNNSTGLAFGTFIAVFFANMNYWATLATDIPTLTRYVKAPAHERSWWRRNKSAIIPHLTALPLTQSLMILIGGVAMIAIGNWNPVEAIQTTASGVVLVILLILVVFAQWSTNSAANLIPSAVTLINAGGNRISYVGGVVLAGIIGSIIQPWQVMDAILGFLSLYGAILSAICGILFADYYLIRKRRVNVPDLYKHDGQYRYAGGWNWAGIIAWVVGGAVAIALSTYAFIVGWVVGGAVYYVLAKYWWFKMYKQAEIEENYSDKYLGTSVGRDWVIDDEILQSSSSSK